VNGKPVSIQDCSGFQLPFTPKYSGNVSYSHTFDLGHSGSVIFGATASFAGSTPLDFDRIPADQAPAYISPDFDLTYKTVDGRFSLTGYVRNANNAVIYNSINTQSNPQLALLRAPQTFGGRLTAKF